MCEDGNDNTIVTIGDINYLWGIFLLIASARKAGMSEPFLVGTKEFNPDAERVLTQLGNVSFVRLDGMRRSLTCYKPYVMLRAKTKFVTWADSDAFFTGNVSSILKPASEEDIHFRLRAPTELPGAFWRSRFDCDGKSVPEQVLEVWRQDVQNVAGVANEDASFRTTGSACFLSLSLEDHRRFLEVWHSLQMTVLPDNDVGVVDRSLISYPQLDESTLNACLAFFPGAPHVQEKFCMDKERNRLFVHFIARPKPWQGWTRRAFRFFDDYVSIVDWSEVQGYKLPGDRPQCLKASRKTLMRLLIPWMTFKPKLARRLRRLTMCCAAAPLAPRAWRANKLKRKLCKA